MSCKDISRHLIAFPRKKPTRRLRVKMPRGPKGEKRLADVIGNAVHVMRIATGEAEDTVADDGKTAGAFADGHFR
jgi:hypothetical protein